MLLFIAREELVMEGIVVCVTMWLGLIVGFVVAGISPLDFVTLPSVLDIGIILSAFGGSSEFVKPSPRRAFSHYFI